MPMYDYQCASCGHSFSMRRKVSERKDPESEECPGCTIRGFISLVIGTPLVSYSTNPGIKTTDNFNSRLQEIAKTKGKDHTIHTRRGEI